MTDRVAIRTTVLRLVPTPASDTPGYEASPRGAGTGEPDHVYQARIRSLRAELASLRGSPPAEAS